MNTDQLRQSSLRLGRATKNLTKKSITEIKALKTKNLPYLKQKDWLAQPINFFYQGASAQGTLLGGCFSCCATIFFFMFVCI